jgi:18S rRNA (adenine1779-N6/adenine1780-N6)-dimethyltransferase
MLEQNYKTYCALHEIMLDHDFDIKTKVFSIIEKSGYAEHRAAKMDLDDLLKLLYAFNQEGIHFA